jgi:hypothetical protein
MSLVKSPMRRKKRIEYISEKISTQNSSYMSHLLNTNLSRSQSVSMYLDLCAGSDLDEASDQISDINSDQTIPDQEILCQEITNHGKDPHLSLNYKKKSCS